MLGTMRWAEEVELDCDATQISDDYSSSSDAESEGYEEEGKYSSSNEHSFLTNQNFEVNDRINTKYPVVDYIDPYCIGIFATKGIRVNMEDRLAVESNISAQRGIRTFLGVYDGHGGSACVSTWLENNLHLALRRNLSREMVSIESALVETYRDLDLELLRLAREDIKARKEENGSKISRTKSTRFNFGNKYNKERGSFATAGSTATTLLLVETQTGKREIILGWTGDSRAVLCRSNVAFELTNDHKPSESSERSRIASLSGVVDKNGRLNRVIDVSRAFASFPHKAHDMNMPAEPEVERRLQLSSALSVLPETLRLPLIQDDQFVVLGTDGIWSSLSSNDAVHCVLNHFKAGDSAQTAAEDLERLARAAGAKDNITAIVIYLQESF